MNIEINTFPRSTIPRPLINVHRFPWLLKKKRKLERKILIQTSTIAYLEKNTKYANFFVKIGSRVKQWHLSLICHLKKNNIGVLFVRNLKILQSFELCFETDRAVIRFRNGNRILG